MRNLTPNALRYLAAPASLVALTIMLAGTTVPACLTDGGMGALAYAATLFTLMVFPRIRSSDLVSCLTVLFSLEVMVGMVFSQRVDILRWLSMLAGSGAAILPLRIRDLRKLAAENGYLSFAEWGKLDRRAKAGRQAEASVETSGARQLKQLGRASVPDQPYF